MLLLLVSCHPPPEDPLRADFEKAEPSEWVRVLDPGRASPGYNLMIFRRRIPMLLDLSGRIVHAWPDVRATGRARLTREGHLYLITVLDRIEEYDWDGTLVLSHGLPGGAFPHHDVVQIGNGHFLFPAKFERARSDSLVEMDRSGAIVWRWNLADHRDRFPSWDDDVHDASHVNSVQEIGPNPLFEGGDTRFRPGNVLVSARNLSTIFIVDRTSGEVVWQRSEGLDKQHEARLLSSSHAGAGLISLFNNRYHHRLGGSRIEIFDPVGDRPGFSYASPYFYSSVGGIVQVLPNESLLVSSSHSGRVFELTRSGDVVWQFEPPYGPMRPVRYAKDYCPQLARMAPRTFEAVGRSGGPFVDEDLYAFLLPDEKRRRVEGFPKFTLPGARACRVVRLPPDARMAASYGFHPDTPSDAEIDARFAADVGLPGSEQRISLFDEPLSFEPGKPARRRTTRVSLADWALEDVEICVDAHIVRGPAGLDPDDVLVWAAPKIMARRDAEEEPALTAEEQRLREEQLRRIGYVQ